MKSDDNLSDESEKEKVHTVTERVPELAPDIIGPHIRSCINRHLDETLQAKFDKDYRRYTLEKYEDKMISSQFKIDEEMEMDLEEMNERDREEAIEKDLQESNDGKQDEGDDASS